MKELKTIFPPKIEVLFSDKTIEIKSIALEDVSVLGEIGDKLFNRAVAILKMNLSETDLGLALAQELILVLKNDSKLLIQFLQATTTVDPKILPKISLEAAVFLLKEAVEVNKDFLYQKVKPMVQDLMAELGPKAKTNG